MLEYADGDTHYEVHKEGDFIKYMAIHWKGLSKDTRVGVVPYHDVATDIIRITDNDYADFLSDIDQLSRRLQPGGKADLVKALDFVRDNSFTGARDGVPKVVIAIINQLDNTPDELLAAANRIKQSCINLITLFVEGNPRNDTLVQQIASQPHSHFFRHYDRFSDLRNDQNGFNIKC